MAAGTGSTTKRKTPTKRAAVARRPAAAAKAALSASAGRARAKPATKRAAATATRAPVSGNGTGPHATRGRTARAQKWVWLFTEGDASKKDLLGGKGAGVAEMTRAGLPVPTGFTITTEACNAYYARDQKFPEGMWDQVLAGLRDVEKKTAKHFGDPANPLLVSVRSGAKFSMPGMMDTVLNLGLNTRTLVGLAGLTGDERFALDAYRRFIQLFSKIVLGMDGDIFEHALDGAKLRAKARTDADLKPDALRTLVADYKRLVMQHAGIAFPEDPIEQLREAIGAVFS